MDINNPHKLYAANGSWIDRKKACGYCYLHHIAMSPASMKTHECLKKQCPRLKKYEDHPFWVDRARKNELKKQHRAEGNAYAYHHYSN